MKDGKYKSFILTPDMLRRVGACEAGIYEFNNHFPRGLKVSNCTEEMIIRASETPYFYGVGFLVDYLSRIHNWWTPLPFHIENGLENVAYLLSDTKLEDFK